MRPAVAFLLLCFGLAALAPANPCYVSASGNDTNPGTETQPWRTIQHACDEVPAHGIVEVETGVYKEAVIIRRAMTLTRAPGAAPVIDGTGLAVPDKDAALVLINNLSNVALVGFEIRNYQTTVSGNTPAGVLVEGEGNDIMIMSNSVHNIENTGSDAGSINAFSIAVYGDSPSGAITNLTIEGNVIYDTKTGNSENLTLNGNVNGFKVIGNTVHDVNNIAIDCIGFEGTSPILGQDQARNGVVEFNQVYNVTSLSNPAYGGQQSADGIYVDGGANITIYRNLVHKADIGIEVASEHLNHFAYEVVVKDNAIYNCNVVGLSVGGYASNVGGTQNCGFYNNTLYENDTTNSGSGELQIQYNTANNVLANNIFSASSQGILISGVTGTGSKAGVVSNYNLFYAPANIEWDWDGAQYFTLTSFKATGNDKDSLTGNPLFVGSGTGNFRTSVQSPAIAVGSVVYTSALDEDLGGSARVYGGEVDAGAYQLDYSVLSAFAVKPEANGTYLGEVVLSSGAKGPGLILALSSSSSAITFPNGSPKVDAGLKEATFQIKASAVTATLQVTLTATLGTVRKSVTLTLNPPIS
jgi:hypothetical protein